MTGRELIQALGGRWHGSYGTARCPAHEDKNPSLSVSERDGKVLLKCHADCDQEAVIDALRERGLWDDHVARRTHVDQRAHVATRRSTLSAPESNPNGEAALAIWRAARTPEGTLVETYLAARGITIPIPASIRFHPGLKHGPTGLELPAMVAAVQAPDRSITGIHRTFLTMDGAKKAPVSSNKMMLGKCASGAVRLAAVADRLALTEGIETALSVLQATGIPTWATLSTGGLKAVIVPDEVNEVIICADGDEAGEKAANDVAQRFLREGRMVRIARPPAGMDFNDLLVLPEDVLLFDVRKKEPAHG